MSYNRKSDQCRTTRVNEVFLGSIPNVVEHIVDQAYNLVNLNKKNSMHFTPLN